MSSTVKADGRRSNPATPVAAANSAAGVSSGDGAGASAGGIAGGGGSPAADTASRSPSGTSPMRRAQGPAAAPKPSVVDVDALPNTCPQCGEDDAVWLVRSGAPMCGSCGFVLTAPLTSTARSTPSKPRTPPAVPARGSASAPTSPAVSNLSMTPPSKSGAMSESSPQAGPSPNRQVVTSPPPQPIPEALTPTSRATRQVCLVDGRPCYVSVRWADTARQRLLISTMDAQSDDCSHFEVPVTDVAVAGMPEALMSMVSEHVATKQRPTAVLPSSPSVPAASGEAGSRRTPRSLHKAATDSPSMLRRSLGVGSARRSPTHSPAASPARTAYSAHELEQIIASVEATLRQQLHEENQQQLTQLHDQLHAEFAGERQALQEQLAAAKAQQSDITTRLFQERDAIHAEFQQQHAMELQSFMQKHSELERQLDAAIRSNAVLQAQVVRLEHEADTFKSAFARADADRINMDAQIKKYMSHVGRLSAEAEEARGKQTDVSVELVRAKKVHAEAMQDALRRHQEEKAQLTAKYAAIVEKLQKDGAELAGVLVEARERLRQAEIVKQMHAESEGHVTRLQTENHNLTSQVHGLQQQVSQGKAHQEFLQAQLHQANVESKTWHDKFLALSTNGDVIEKHHKEQVAVILQQHRVELQGKQAEVERLKGQQAEIYNMAMSMVDKLEIANARLSAAGLPQV